MEKERLTPSNVWDSTQYRFSQAIRVRQCQDLLFIAGQAGIDEQGRIVQGLEPQIRQSFENIRRIVTAAGGSMANIVKITGYFTDMRALETYTKLLDEVFIEEFPAATVVQVNSLALEPLLVEIDAIAAL